MLFGRIEIIHVSGYENNITCWGSKAVFNWETRYDDGDFVISGDVFVRTTFARCRGPGEKLLNIVKA